MPNFGASARSSDSGSDEVPYFNRCFRRRFGASPTQYRRQEHG
jgi:AraC-like DNA-binding protein